MIRLFKRNRASRHVIHTDIHSHLLPGLDDGVKTIAEAETIIRAFHHLGYKKLITTPHVMQDYYRNTPESIRSALEGLQRHLETHAIPIQLEAAAEYYLDEELLKMMESNQPLLTFGKSYLLFETNFINEPLNLKEFVFIANTKGYVPVLAHPERYMYLQDNMKKIEDLIDRGVLLQVNIGSILGLYNKQIQNFAIKLVSKGMPHFLGSDCHNEGHLAMMEAAMDSKYYRRALELPLLNNSL